MRTHDPNPIVRELENFLSLGLATILIKVDQIKEDKKGVAHTIKMKNIFKFLDDKLES
jgi:hypothetical protein